MAEIIKNKKKILSKNLFPVVGIGASAGGLEAFKKLIKAIPDHSGIAYILVQHLHPDHSSALPEILQRESTIPVHEISDNVKVKPNNIYVIPSNKLLIATDGILKLSPRPSKDQRNMPIDIFFSSLAEVHQSHAIGIVLSGNGADGTKGLKNIKDQGGITFAENPESAAYDGMPFSAIQAGVVDFIMPPGEMPEQLIHLNNTFNILPSNEDSTGVTDAKEESFKQILALLRANSGVDFTYYKQSTIRRRILRRMVIIKVDNIAQYLSALKKSKEEQDNLFQDMLIPVTAFFRDPKIFQNLSRIILPELVKNKSSLNPLRIWVAGCSTGKEAYSIAMSLHEYLSDQISTIKVQIFATDISQVAIAKARVGMYDANEMDGLSDERKEQFFIKNQNHYHIKKSIRDMCIFAEHNFLKDPPFAKIDLVSCRNVLIYLEPFLQKKAFTIFHYALNPKGHLWLGRSESTGSSSEYFLEFGTKDKFYTRRTFPGRYINLAPAPSEKEPRSKFYSVHPVERKGDNFQKDADDILLSRYTPPGVIVNEQLDIVQFRGTTGDFLEPSPGKASLNVLKMAREGLSFEIRNALQKAKKTKESFSKNNILLQNSKKLINIEVVPLLNTADPHYLILFKESSPVTSKTKGSIKELKPGLKSSPEQMRIRQLEKDLSQGREDMRGVTEEQEAANEELQSANEELLSGSEELQSLNEELETSKEELQSTNEELITVNQELFDRNEQFNKEKLFAEAIVSTIHEPLLVLSNDFKIIRANKSFYKTFLLTEEETLGKVLFDLQNKAWIVPGLQHELLKIQNEGEKLVELEISYSFPGIGMRTICFNARPIQKENKKHLILLALDDVTSRKEIERVAVKNAEDLKKVLENIPQITFTTDANGTINYFNQHFLDYSGLDFSEAIASGLRPLIKPEMQEEFSKAWTHSMKTGERFNMEVLLMRKADKMYRWHVSGATTILNDEGKIISWVGSAIDNHEQKTKERLKDEFIAIASHELKTPLTTAKAYIQLLQHSMAETQYKDLNFADKAAASIDRLNDLIGELMDVSKIQNGKLDLNVTSFNFNEMIAEAVESIQLGALLHQIKISGSIKGPVTADKERLKQVVINLLSNAVKYSPGAKSVFVNVGTKKGNIEVSIKDTGIGIRKESLEKIFERYYREEHRAVNFQGLGIGLFISYEIIQRHHGIIWAESEPGKGSTFYFTIPKAT